MSDAVRQGDAARRQGSVVSASQVAAAGFASATAAFVTSKFGVTGTLIGASITAMIITGGSAILKSYLENLAGNMKIVPQRIRTRGERQKAGRYAEPSTLPGRPDLRNNFPGRMRAALDWFSHLPPLTRRSILIKGLIAATAAFVIGMGAVYGVERVINNSLSCGIWGNCPKGAVPGIHIGNGDAAGTAPSIRLGGAQSSTDRKSPDAKRIEGGDLDSGQRNSLRQQGGGRQQDAGDEPPAQRRDKSGGGAADPGAQAPGSDDPVLPGEETNPSDESSVPPDQDAAPSGGESSVPPR